MGASTKILPRKPKSRRYRIRLRYRLAVEIRRLRAKCAALEKQNRILKEENERLRAQLNLVHSEDEQNGKSGEANHWRRRYALKQLEMEKLQGELSLARARISELEADVIKKKARIDDLTRKLFDPSSEKGALQIDNQSAASTPASESVQSHRRKSPKRKRGGQPGTPRSGPRNHDHLPIGEDKTCELDESCCEECGEQWTELSTSGSEQVEVAVRAHRRRITRKKYQHFCKKKQRWVTKRASGPKLLFPHSQYGIVWVFLLVGRYVIHTAMNRVCALLKQNQLYVPQGTIYAGFRRIHQLIKPLIAEIRRYSRDEKHHWHIDDTGWKVFVVIDEKTGFGWYLWVFLSDNVCLYILSPSRARAVPKSHLQNSVGVVTSDRLSANKKLGDNVQNSYCWVHERREFRNLARAYPEIAAICLSFLDLIGALFHLNAQRLMAEASPAEQAASESKLKRTLDQIYKSCQNHLAEPNLHPELRRVFNGMVKDEAGLRLFLDIPEVPPDNNPAEQALRGPVVDRKCSYGNHSLWSAQFTADMYTLCETLKLNNIDVSKFLTQYLQACADNDGKPPPNAAQYLPWHRSPPS
jgi:transposase